MATRMWRRRNYLIDKDFQFRYIGRIVFGMIIMALVLGFTVYFTTWARIMDEFYTIPKIASQYAALFGSVTKVMAVFLLLFLIVAAVVSVFTSHSIAGPMYRFEKTLQAIAQGDLTLRIGLRKTDEFKHVAETLNRMVIALHAKLSADSDLIRELAAITDHIGAASAPKGGKPPAALVRDLERLRATVGQLQENLGKFKLT